ncbi:LamB/YcsF family protein [Cocleimonas flava]|uniref:UPF0271 protein n=1 Tax=Cocleimonas flava TaxID=634765 RepID=A0A4R1EYB9_9GAMM|nr:5-oxoprolinase subunit PxpA [Cocleimonas flava]TCJ85014.1 UPF0271 protein [Cocleimonas flava]
MNIDVNINCDMGESFGIYQLGNDEAIMPFITEANIACGFHASDPNHMMNTAVLAKKHNVRVGAHFSLPDLVGFGRREMKVNKTELYNIVVYQVGALMGFLKKLDVPLSHLKAHGALYGMASRQEHVAEIIADVGDLFKVPVLGITGTKQEEQCKAKGVEFKSEFFADLDYDDNGGLIISRVHEAVDPEKVVEKCLSAIKNGTILSVNGKELAVKAETICVHSDTPNAVEIAESLSTALKQM